MERDEEIMEELQFWRKFYAKRPPVMRNTSSLAWESTKDKYPYEKKSN